MKIEELYENWQIKLKAINRAKAELAQAEKEALAEEQKLYSFIYEKRDSHLKHYKTYLIQSGSSVFSFEFTGKNGAGSSIKDFKRVEYPSLDE